MIINIYNDFVNYVFSFEGKFNVLAGDSGNGKTLFVDSVRDYLGENLFDFTCMVNSEVATSKVIYVYENGSACDSIEQERLLRTSGCVYIIDENSGIRKSPDFLKVLRESKNYFIIVSRDLKLSLNVSIDSIYYFDYSSSFAVARPMYCENNSGLYKYGSKIDKVYAEDSVQGKKFLKRYFYDCTFPWSKSNNAKFLKLKPAALTDALLVLDASAFGTYYGLLLQILEESDGTYSLFTWESFETYILQCKPFNKCLTKVDVGCKYTSIEKLASLTLYNMVGYSKHSSKGELPLCLDSKCTVCSRASSCVYQGKCSIWLTKDMVKFVGIKRLVHLGVLSPSDIQSIWNTMPKIRQCECLDREALLNKYLPDYLIIKGVI